MPVLSIGDKEVTVGDEFLKLSPEQQNAAVADIAKSMGMKGAAPADEPVTVNKVVRSAAEGVPIVGGVLNKLNAATNATLAPAIEPLLTPSESDISRPGPSTEKIGDIPLPARPPGWMERYRRSLEMQNKGDEKFAAAHPYIDTAAKVTGGVAGTIPAMMAAPVAFGLTGTLPQMVARGAASNAALGAADAAVRGEGVVTPAAVGGVVGAAAPLAGRAVGKLVQGVRDMRNPQPVVPQNVERVAGVDIPLTSGQAAADPAIQAEEEIMRRGARGTSAEEVARQADQQAHAALAEASGNIGRALDPAAASPRTAPQAAGEVVQSELAQQEAARLAAEAARVSQVGAEGEGLTRGLGGGAAPASPFDAAESVGAGVTARRNAKVEATKEAYRARDAVTGSFDESVPQTMAEDIRTRLNSGENPLWVDPTNESTANQALKLIDQTVGKNSGLLRNSVLPETPAPAAAAPAAAAPAAGKPAEDEAVAALRAKFGDAVADKYAQQAGVPTGKAAPPPLSLLEFVASKGGLKPDAELGAIGLDQAHRQQIPGQKGFFGTVRKNGSELDRMREAAEEAGYLRGENGATSTPRQFLDAIDAELRGQKVYPEGREGFVGKKAGEARATAERSAMDRVNAGFEQDLQAAGYGDLGHGMRERTISLMRDEGMAADDAVETALRQLEREDAVAASKAASDFPGDSPMVSPGEAAAARPVDLKAMDEARKRLVTMYGDAKSKAITSGDKSDMRAMAKILNEFDNVISDALASGKFSGDAALAKELQDAARRSHAEYRQTFSSRGPGDEIGRAVEKILGRYHDTAATPSEIASLAYGPKSAPGSGNTEKIALRLRDILGENSAEWQQYKQGLFQHIADAEAGAAPLSPTKAAGRIDNFLHGKTSRFANKIFTAEQRQQMAQYARNLRSIEPSAAPKNDLDKAIARIAGTDGHLPATPGQVADMLYNQAGTKTSKGISVHLAEHLKRNLKPESWAAVRQGMWEKLVNAGDGKIPFEAQALSQRLHEFLNESGSGLAKSLFSPAEIKEMRALASVYKRMAPLKGTTNPSGSATIGTKIASKALDNLGAMLGFGAHGITGAIVGHGVQKAVGALKDAKAAKEATRLFFGPQAKRAAATSRLPALIAPAAVAGAQR